jgi:hypothetical protein
VIVNSVLELTGPLNPSAPAVMIAVPASIAVTSPVVLTVATAGEFEVQVTVAVMFCFEG